MRAPAERTEAADRLRPFVEKARGFSGWSFEEIPMKTIGPAIPWDYEGRARVLLRSASSVLDMGTGGGELFASLLDARRRSVATESWSRNARVAAERLGPIGCGLVKSDSLRLPFRDRSFSLVLNRHEELDPTEVARVLDHGGRLLTQQVGSRHWEELGIFFPRKRDFGPLFDVYQRGLKTAGLSVTRAEEHETKVRYAGLGDVVYLLCVAPWEIPGFAPLGADLDALLDMERTLLTEDGIVLTEDRFLLEAEKS
jgi:SAM-dependent methyltransferase